MDTRIANLRTLEKAPGEEIRNPFLQFKGTTVTDTRLYTVFLDHAGGTYIGQEPAGSASKAVFRWIASIPDEELIRWGIAREELAAIVRSDQPIPVAGLLNVWCISGSTKKGLALINVVATNQSLD